MTTKPHQGNRLEALLKQLPPLIDNPDFVADIIGTLRRGHRIRAGIIAGSILAGLGAMLALVPFELIREILAFLGTWSSGIDISTPELTKENLVAAAVVIGLFLISLMAVQEA